MNSATITGAQLTIGDGDVLHVRAPALPGKRNPRRYPMPAVDLTVGPDAKGGFLVVDYTRRRSGVEDAFASAPEAIRVVVRALGSERMGALRLALRKIHGEPERPDASRLEEDARAIARGARLRAAFEHRGGIIGPLFGPMG